jgi:hypothetical protein
VSVSNLVTAQAYIGDGSDDTFAITFDFKAASHVKVILKDTVTLAEVVQAQPADFSVVGTDIVFVTPPAATKVIIIYRESPRTQTTTYLTTGPFLPADHENGIDKLLLQIQELARDVARSIKVSLGNSLGIYAATTVLPDELTPDYALVVNATGDGFDLVDLTSITGSAYITAINNVGSSPNDAGMSVTGSTLNLEPADSTHPGLINAITQTFGGAKTFLADLTAGAKLIVTTYLQRSAASGLTAFAGGGQASALQLAKDVNRVTTVATSGDSVKLPPALAGMKVVVINDGANSMNVFPSSGEQIDALGVDAAFALTTTAKNTTFVCASAGLWKSIAGAGGGGGGGAWGSIIGTLSDQTDLQTALNAKAPTASPTFTGTITTPLTASRAVVSNASSQLAVSATTDTQIGYLSTLASDVQVQITALINTITSALTLAGSGALSISATKRFQTFLVQGNSAAVTLSTTPFGATPPPDGGIIYLIGNSDTNTVEIPVNDAANGCLMDGSVILAKGQTASFMYSSTLARYVRL